jgi:hypothetical protein
LFWQRVDDPHRFEAESDDLTDEADDIFGIAFAIRIGTDAAACVFGDAVLVNNPLQR